MNTILIIYVICMLFSAVMISPKVIQLFYCKRLPAQKKAIEKRRIALVIPARNESKIIGDLFESIEAQSYDKDMLSVNIIVKDKLDNTVELASKLGYNVYVVPNQTCKGEALDGFFKQAPHDCDAYAIIDADAVLTPNYVEELNNALEYDKQIFATKKLVKNYLGDKSHRSTVSNVSALIYPMTDECGNLYRQTKNIPLNLVGQGLMVRREVIEEIGGWPYRTLTEDYELKMDSMVRGFSSMYYPYAVLYTEEAISYKESRKRRLRWVTGYSQCDKKYSGDVKNAIKGRKKGRLAIRYDMFLFKCPIFFYLTASFCTQTVGIIMALKQLHTPMFLQSMLLVALPIAVTYFVLFIYGAVLMKCADMPVAFSEKLAALLVFPLYILDFVPIYIQGLLGVVRNRPSEWKETERLERVIK